ncbi:MAG: hypothetical protein RI924_896 [Bacteroidota bacterium]|jgi:predicted RNase H-like HicB family nuclease
MIRKVSVIIEKDEMGFYAHVPELPGCQSQGDTYDQVIDHIREAIDLYLEALTPEEKLRLTSREIESTFFEVEIG